MAISFLLAGKSRWLLFILILIRCIGKTVFAAVIFALKLALFSIFILIMQGEIASFGVSNRGICLNFEEISVK